MKRTKEKVVLVFHSSVRTSWSETQSGIYRFVRPQGWNVQVVEHEPSRKSIVELLAFWHPVGVIVECGVDACSSVKSRVFRSANGESPADECGVKRRRRFENLHSHPESRAYFSQMH